MVKFLLSAYKAKTSFTKRPGKCSNHRGGRPIWIRDQIWIYLGFAIVVVTVEGTNFMGTNFMDTL